MLPKVDVYVNMRGSRRCEKNQIKMPFTAIWFSKNIEYGTNAERVIPRKEVQCQEA